MIEVETKAAALANYLGKAARRFTIGCARDGQDAIVTSDDGHQRFHVVSLSAPMPELVHILGETDDGTHIEVCLHYSAVRLTMLAVSKADDRPKPRGIGFTADHRDERDETHS